MCQPDIFKQYILILYIYVCVNVSCLPLSTLVYQSNVCFWLKSASIMNVVQLNSGNYITAWCSCELANVLEQLKSNWTKKGERTRGAKELTASKERCVRICKYVVWSRSCDSKNTMFRYNNQYAWWSHLETYLRYIILQCIYS